MKRTLIIMLSLMALSLAAPSGFAVEKKSKDSTSARRQQTAQPAPKKQEKAKEQPKQRQASDKSQTKKFDSFVDKNKNGVDDRQEKTARKDDTKK